MINTHLSTSSENQKCCINKGKSEQSYKLNEILNVNISYGCNEKNLPNSNQINSPLDNVHINDDGNVNVDEIMNLCQVKNV